MSCSSSANDSAIGSSHDRAVDGSIDVYICPSDVCANVSRAHHCAANFPTAHHSGSFGSANVRADDTRTHDDRKRTRDVRSNLCCTHYRAANNRSACRSAYRRAHYSTVHVHIRPSDARTDHVGANNCDADNRVTNDRVSNGASDVRTDHARTNNHGRRSCFIRSNVCCTHYLATNICATNNSESNDSTFVRAYHGGPDHARPDNRNANNGESYNNGPFGAAIVSPNHSRANHHRTHNVKANGCTDRESDSEAYYSSLGHSHNITNFCTNKHAHSVSNPIASRNKRIWRGWRVVGRRVVVDRDSRHCSCRCWHRRHGVAEVARWWQRPTDGAGQCERVR